MIFIWLINVNYGGVMKYHNILAEYGMHNNMIQNWGKEKSTGKPSQCGENTAFLQIGPSIGFDQSILWKNAGTI